MLIISRNAQNIWGNYKVQQLTVFPLPAAAVNSMFPLPAVSSMELPRNKSICKGIWSTTLTHACITEYLQEDTRFLSTTALLARLSKWRC